MSLVAILLSLLLGQPSTVATGPGTGVVQPDSGGIPTTPPPTRPTIPN